MQEQIIQLEEIKTKKQVFQLIQQECLKLGYSYKTIKNYVYWSRKYLNYVKGKYKENNLRDFHLDEFIAYLTITEHKKPTSRNNAVWALVFLFEKCLGKKIPEDKYPTLAKIPSTMPNVLLKEQIKRMIDSISCSTKSFTLKHRLYIELPYSAGLRLSETIKLRMQDIDLEHNVIYVRNAKGERDRTTQLSQQTKKDILEYKQKRKYQSNPYLLDRGSTYHISGRTIWKVLKRQARICNIAQRVYPHILRDSFATHLLWDGIDSRFIQLFLGHKNLNTTTKYTRVADPQLFKIKSPLDT